MRYIDSAARQKDQTVRAWLEYLLPTANLFACQTGYFSADALSQLEPLLGDLIGRGGQLRLVVGFNDGALQSDALGKFLEIIEGHAGSSLIVAGASDILMHSKSYFVQSESGTCSALVGSANFTGRGISSNIECAITASTAEDDPAVLESIRAGIFAWESADSSLARVVDFDELEILKETGAVDAPRAADPSTSEQKKTRQTLFKRLGSIFPRTVEGPPSAEPGPPPPTATIAFPGGAVGILKSASKPDTKAFRGEKGTAHIALAKDLAALLPMEPAGRKQEPRLNLNLTARIDAVPGERVQGGTSTNITYVGMGIDPGSHKDLRLNYLADIGKGILRLCETHDVTPPAEHDVIAVRFFDAQHAEIVFVTQEPRRAELTETLEAAGREWTWLDEQTANQF